jgi:hypothetical protein
MPSIIATVISNRWRRKVHVRDRRSPVGARADMSGAHLHRCPPFGVAFHRPNSPASGKSRTANRDTARTLALRSAQSASAELSRRVGKVVSYPPLGEMDADHRREFHEALLDAIGQSKSQEAM